MINKFTTMGTAFRTTLRTTVAAIAIASFVPSALAAPGQIFKIYNNSLSAAYVGRCLRTDFRLQTDNLNANSADLVLPYSPAYLQPYSDSNCTTSATQLVTDGLFPTYPGNGNVISGNVAQLTGADFSNSSPVNTGAAPADSTFAHLFWKVLSASGSFNLGYDFTLGDTTDTNAAEQNGNGSDVLDAVENLSMILSQDTNAPTFSSLSPAAAATNVSVTSDLSLVATDTGAGLASNTLKVAFNSAAQTVSVSGCTQPNSYTNVTQSCNMAVTLPTLSYNTTYYVSATGSDVASPQNNTGSTSWSFTTEDDDDPPYVTDRVPGSGSTGVSTSSDIVFHVKDYLNQAGVTPGLGVDINTVKVTVQEGAGTPVTYGNGSGAFSFSGTSADYTITINPPTDFGVASTITVTVNAADLHSPANVMSPVVYSFITADNGGPNIIVVSPLESATNVDPLTNVVIRMTDSGAGMDLANSTITVEGVTYTNASAQWTQTGSSADYTITINPTGYFPGGTVVDVSVTAKDLNAPANTSTKSYSFTIDDTCETCFVDREDPDRFSNAASASQDIVFHVNDTGAGISSGSIVVILTGTGNAFTGTPMRLTGSSVYFARTGTSSDYTITINLPFDLTENSPVGVQIDATDIYERDMATVYYTFVVDTDRFDLALCPVTTETVAVETTSGGGGGGARRGTIEQSTERVTELIAQWQNRYLLQHASAPTESGATVPEEAMNELERELDQCLQKSQMLSFGEQARANPPTATQSVNPFFSLFPALEVSNKDVLHAAAPTGYIAFMVPTYVYHVFVGMGLLLVLLLLFLQYYLLHERKKGR